MPLKILLFIEQKISFAAGISYSSFDSIDGSFGMESSHGNINDVTNDLGKRQEHI